MASDRGRRVSSPESGGVVASFDAEQLAVGEVARRLDLSERAVSWLRRIERRDGLPGPVLPDDAEAERLLKRLGVDPADREDTLAARPDPQRDPALWWVLDRVYHLMIDTMGAGVPIEGHLGWPGLPTGTGAAGRHLYVWVYLAVLPGTRRYHRAHEIPDLISWDSLALGEVLRAHRAITGQSGLGLFNRLWSPPLRLRGAQYRLRRLEYNRGAISFSNGPCGYTLGVHVPGGVPLDSAACEESLTAAREFFPRHFPEEAVAIFSCSSWLMDPQLADYLPASSNLVQFQRRFQLVPLTPDEKKASGGDHTVLDWVFSTSYEASEIPAEFLDQLPQDTTLQRAGVAHLRSGRHWHSRTGWSPF